MYFFSFILVLLTSKSITNTHALVLNQKTLLDSLGSDSDLKYIDLSGLNIESIDSFSFSGFSNLEEIHLENNKLVKIENGMFNGLANLRQIWLESNAIELIDKNAFQGLKNLELICLYNNPITLNSSDLQYLCQFSSKCIVKTNDKCTKSGI